MKYMFIVENLKTKFKHNSQLSPSLNFGLLPLIFFFPSPDSVYTKCS